MSSSGSSPSRLTGSGGLSCAPGPVLIIEKRSLAFAQRLGNGRFRAPYYSPRKFFRHRRSREGEPEVPHDVGRSRKAS